MIKPIYRASKVHKRDIWQHVLRVSRYAKYFARKTGANQLVAEIGGLLHDIGLAKHGKKKHHIKGAKEAEKILRACKCSEEFIGPIISTIYFHRARHRFVSRTRAAKCVAAADALDHFRGTDVSATKVHRIVSEKLKRNWAKIDTKIRPLFNVGYGRVRQEVLKVVLRKGKNGA
jgi:putative nucleotidyltransferase with HDIG domain